MNPPTDMVGGVMGTQLVIAKTETTAAILSKLVAYPSGFSVEITVVSRTPLPSLQPRLRPGSEDREAAEREWRFGIGMSDGTKATVERGRPSAVTATMNLLELADTKAPPHPAIWLRNSSGREDRWEVNYWIAPLPPPGPLAIAVRWHEAGLTETVYTLEAQAILDLAARAEPIWSVPESAD